MERVTFAEWVCEQKLGSDENNLGGLPYCPWFCLELRVRVAVRETLGLAGPRGYSRYGHWWWGLYWVGEEQRVVVIAPFFIFGL